MADIENKHEKALRDLVASAEAALSELDGPVVETPEAAEAVRPISEATEAAAAKVDWNDETAGLEFAEGEAVQSLDDDGPVTYAANDDAFDKEEARATKLQALAERVAKTRAENEAADADGQMGFIALEQELEASENDADEEPEEFIRDDQLMSIIESLLFSTDKPVSTASIKMIFKGTNVRTKDITRALDLLASEYAGANRGVSLEEINGGYQLRTKADNAEFLRRLAKVRPFRLSGPALEVMAIVAYKQPVTRHEIDEIRGVESGHLLRALMERGMVCFQGKSDLPGHPMAYGTTRKFLETFGLRNLRELPTLGEIDELLPEGIGEVEEEKEHISDLTERLSNQVTGSYSEGEEELAKINDQLKSVDTTTEFFEQEKIRERERRDRERAQDLRERIMLGEEVDKSDRRWLDRYDAKLLAADQALEQQPIAADSNAEVMAQAEDGSALRGELAALTETSMQAANAEDEAAAEEMLEEFNEDIGDDLSVNMDWDEDAESEKES